jgi:hypothetical protein
MSAPRSSADGDRPGAATALRCRDATSLQMRLFCHSAASAATLTRRRFRFTSIPRYDASLARHADMFIATITRRHGAAAVVDALPDAAVPRHGACAMAP